MLKLPLLRSITLLSFVLLFNSVKAQIVLIELKNSTKLQTQLRSIADGDLQTVTGVVKLSVIHSIRYDSQEDADLQRELVEKLKETDVWIYVGDKRIDTSSSEAERLAEMSYREAGSFGIGAGLDYGGLGGKLTFYPGSNFGLFLAGGYAFAGFGYNVGVTLRTGTKKKTNAVFTGMYGYNAAIAVQGGPSSFKNKVYYGTSIGFGLESKSGRNEKNYFSFGLILPFRDSSVSTDIKNLRSIGYQISDPWPVLLKVGYHWGF